MDEGVIRHENRNAQEPVSIASYFVFCIQFLMLRYVPAFDDGFQLCSLGDI